MTCGPLLKVPFTLGVSGETSEFHSTIFHAKDNPLQTLSMKQWRMHS